MANGCEIYSIRPIKSPKGLEGDSAKGAPEIHTAFESEKENLMEVREFKDAAKAATAYLNRDGIDIQQSKMLEALGRGFLGRNWATLRARLAAEGLTVIDVLQEPAVALSETIKGLLDALEAQGETKDGHAAGDVVASCKTQGQNWLSILEGLKDVEASRASVSHKVAPPVETGLDFSRVEPSNFSLFAVLENGKELEGEVRVDYATGQMRLISPLKKFAGRNVRTFYLETIHGFEIETRHLLRDEGQGNFCFARQQDFRRFQKAFSWLIEVSQPEKLPKKVPAKICGKVFVRCMDKTESEIPAVLNTLSRQVELLTSAPGADPLPEGPYEREWFLVEHTGTEHDYPAGIDEEGNWFVEECHIQSIKKLLSE